MGLYDLITNRPLTLPSASLSKKVFASTVCARTSGGAILSCAITPIVKVDTNISRTNKLTNFQRRFCVSSFLMRSSIPYTSTSDVVIDILLRLFSHGRPVLIIDEILPERKGLGSNYSPSSPVGVARI